MRPKVNRLFFRVGVVGCLVVDFRQCLTRFLYIYRLVYIFASVFSLGLSVESITDARVGLTINS